MSPKCMARHSDGCNTNSSGGCKWKLALLFTVLFGIFAVLYSRWTDSGLWQSPTGSLPIHWNCSVICCCSKLLVGRNFLAYVEKSLHIAKHMFFTYPADLAASIPLISPCFWIPCPGHLLVVFCIFRFESSLKDFSNGSP